jgi:hypothetical protein
MDLRRKALADTPFGEFMQVKWQPRRGMKEIASIRRDHGINSSYILHNATDEINEERSELEKVLIEYRINGNQYDLFTVNDLLSSNYEYDAANQGNILGEIGERISRKITKYFLKHYSEYGRTGGIFDNRFNPKKREGYIVANTEEYIFKIQRYPNMVLLRKTGLGKYGYEKIKEIDGLFDYRFFNKRHLMVLESKLEGTSIKTDPLKYNLFSPLSLLFPDASFSYIMFALQDAVYKKKEFPKKRELKKAMGNIYDSLIDIGVTSIFFTFNEEKKDFEKMKEHLISQYRLLHNMHITLTHKTYVSDNEILIYSASANPLKRLVRDKHSGLWKEVNGYNSSQEFDNLISE